MIADDGTNLGVRPLQEALALAREQELDLIEVAPSAKPPVARIMDFGKYLYQKEKEARESAKKQKGVEIKGIRIGFNASPHDMELKARQADEFLKEAHKVQVNLILKGRAKYLDKNFIRERLTTFLDLLTVPFNPLGEPLTGPRGVSLTLEHDGENKQGSGKTA